MAKRGRKLVDYDSSRHHLEALQTAKKRDDTKISKVREKTQFKLDFNEHLTNTHNGVLHSVQADDEVNIAQNVFEGINRELRDELPVLFDRYIKDPGLEVI